MEKHLISQENPLRWALVLSIPDAFPPFTTKNKVLNVKELFVGSCVHM